MGKNSRNSWLDAVKKAFRSPTKDEKKSSRRREEIEAEEEEKRRGKKRWMFGRNFSIETTTIHAKCADSSAVRICSGEEALVRKQPKIENGERRAFEAAIATAAVAEAAITTAKAAVEVIRLGRPSAEDRAAVVIQKAFRGYLARRALMALKGVVKLQALIRGHNVRKRAKMTLQCIQSLVRVQTLVCDQRRRLSCEATTLGSMFSRGSMTTSRVSSSLDVDSSELDEIHSLIQKAKECSLKVKDRHHRRRGSHEHLAISLQSPRTPSSTKTACYHTAETPSYGRRMSMSERGYCAVARPNYMAATASAMARVRPSSTPRQRLLSPGREATVECSAKKRLSFHVQEDRPRLERYRGVRGSRIGEPYYGTD